MSAQTHAPSRPVSFTRRTLAAVACVVAGAATVLTGAQTARAASGFTAGDVVVYRVGDGSTALSGTSAPVFLDEYAPGGALVQSVPLPTTTSGANKPLVGSGSANSEGMLTLSADSRFLVATGYDAAVGTAKISGTAAATTPRTVGLVDANDNVNTSTALSDFADGNNPRSAVSTDGTNIWVGGAAGGARFTTVGSTTSTPITISGATTTFKNVRQLGIVDGQLYTSGDPTKAGLTIAPVGTGLPTASSPATIALTNLPFSPAPGDPYGYAFLTLGNGSTPDTLYIADNTAGAIVKYGLQSGTWASQGSVAVPGVTGVTANDNAGVVSLFATSSGSGGTSGTLDEIIDSSGQAGTLTGTATQIATAPSNEAFRGVAFAPGTVIGSGGGTTPPPVLPTITPAQGSLPAAINDPTNPTLGLTVDDANFSADQLTVTATSGDTDVAPQDGIALTGTGADRTLSLTPAAVGYSTITLKVAAPDGTSTTTQITYGVSADLGDPSDRYFSGAGDASSAIDVGDGYMLVADDENDVIRLYNESQSGPPVKTFDFTSQLPFGTAEADLEASARSGDTIYWTGSMSNNDSGDLSPARSTLFATKITGSGADTELTYVGSYTGLQSDLVNWDKTNGHGLGANFLGLDNSVNGGIGSHEPDALNVEGMEFAGSSSSTAYLAFRAPLEPTTDRHLALIVPVTNIDQLVTNGNPGAVHATFGAPMFWNLGGLGVREIRENADGQYLIIAGTSDETNNPFVLYTWDGNPSDPPLATGTSLPLVPAGANQGSWETIVNVPDPLVAGAPVQLLEDNGNTAWYGDDETAKDNLPADLQKDLGEVFSYVPPSNVPVTVRVASDTNPAVTGQPMTLAATVTGVGTSTVPTGTVDFTSDGTDIPGCEASLLTAGTATCAVSSGLVAGGHDIVASYSGDASFAAGDNSADPLVEQVNAASTSTSLSADNGPLVTGQPVTFTATVSPNAPGSPGAATPTGPVEFQADGTDLPGCGAVAVDATGTAECTVPAGFAPSTQTITATYAGDANFTGSAVAPLPVEVDADATTVEVAASANPPVTGQGVVYTAVVAPVGPGSGMPTGTVTFTVTGPKKPPIACAAGNTVSLSGGLASCAIPASKLTVGATYSVAVTYSGSTQFLGSSGSLAQTIAQGAAMVSVTSNANPSVSGAAVTFNASVVPTSPAGGKVTGTVTWTITGADGSVVTCNNADTVNVSGGNAKCAVRKGVLSAASGPYVVAANYSGSTTFTPAFATLTQTLTKATTKTKLQSSANKTSPGQSVTFTATVTSTPASSVPLSGSVTFTVTDAFGNSLLCPASGTGSMAGNGNGDFVATCTVASEVLTFANSPYQVVATYSGDASDLSSSDTTSHSVSKH